MNFFKYIICLLASFFTATTGLFAMNPTQELALLNRSLTALAQATSGAPGPHQTAPTAGAHPTPLRAPMPNKILKEFKLHNGITLSVVEGDLVQQNVQAIVNAANSSLSHGAGIARTISDEAGPELERTQPKSCKLGQACITPSFNLKHKYAKTIDFIIHAVGPNCTNNQERTNFEISLYQAYKNSLNEAITWGVQSIAFPAISVGIFDCPTKEAAQYSLTAILDKMGAIEKSSLKIIRFVIWTDQKSKAFGTELINRIPRYFEAYLPATSPAAGSAAPAASTPAGETKFEEEKKATNAVQETFTVATWNVLAQEYYTKWATGATLSPHKRINLFINYLRGLMQSTDIIVLQESLTNAQNIFAESLRDALGNTTFKVEVSNGLTTLYNTNKFTLKSYQRIVTKKFDNGMLATRFALKNDPKKELLVINTHLTGGVGNGYEQHRIDQLQDAGLKKLIEERKSTPIIMLGDFNTSTSGYAGVFASNAGFNGYPSMGNATKRQTTGFDTAGKLEAYDHIFYTTHYLKLIEAGTIPPAQQLKSMLLTHGNGDQSKPDSQREFPSDHAIALAEFSFI